MVWMDIDDQDIESYEYVRLFTTRSSTEKRDIEHKWETANAIHCFLLIALIKIKRLQQVWPLKLFAGGDIILIFHIVTPSVSHPSTWCVTFGTTVRGYKFNHLAINSTTVVAGKAGFNPASAATAVVEFMAKWSNLCPPTVQINKETFGYEHNKRKIQDTVKNH